MAYVHGKVLKVIKSADGQHCVDIVARDDGFFEFRAYKLDEDGWVPTRNSGLYDKAEAVETEAAKILPWLAAQISN